MKLSIIIPVYNEEGNIRGLYGRLISVIDKIGYDYELVFIDDGSTDGSLSVLKDIQEQDDGVKIISFKRNFGQTAALAAGIENSKGEIIIAMDGDGQNEPESISDLLKKIDEGYDLVAGWRKKRRDSLLTRRLPSMIANRLISMITNVYLHDHGCTMKAIRREALKEISLYGEQHRFISVLLVWSGAKFTEVAVRHSPRLHGRSSYGIMRTFKVLLDLLTLVFIKSYVTKPIYLFGGMGILSIISSIVTIIITLYQKYISTTRLSIINNPLMHLSAMFFTLGVMFLLIGLLAELIIRTYYESTKKSIYLVKEKIGFQPSIRVEEQESYEAL